MDGARGCCGSEPEGMPQGEGLWKRILAESAREARKESALASFLYLTVLSRKSLADVLAFHLSTKLSSSVMDSRSLYVVFSEALKESPEIGLAAEADLRAHFARDPACTAYMQPLLYFKGFHALQAHRINHWLWGQNRKTLAFFLQNRISEVFSIDIHPQARFGKGIMIDHGTGIVVGQTAVLGDGISILHGVTLGGSGKESGDRHPKIGDGVMIGAQASILGNIKVGKCAKIGAGSVVVDDVPPYVTAVGIPAKIVGKPQTGAVPADLMDQYIDVADS